MAIKLKSLNRITEGKKVIGFEILEVATGKTFKVNNEFLIKNIENGKIEVENLKIVNINNKKTVVDQDMLNSIVNKARKEYEQNDTEIMSNKDYDAAYDTLAEMEKTSGKVADDSATRNVGY